VKTVITREELLAVLQAAEAGLSRNEKLEQSTCFVFQSGRVHTFNEEVAVRAKSGFPPGFTGAIQSGTLLAFLKKIPERKVRVQTKGDGELVMAVNGKGSKFRYAEKIQLPLDSVETAKKDDWRPLPANFGEAISIVQECTGKDESKTAMSCVHLTPTHVESFEKFQATRYKIKLPIDSDFLVKPKGLKHVVALDCTKVAVGQEWVHFKNDAGIYISCRRYDEPFPDLQPALDMDGGQTVELPDGLEAAIDRAEVFSKENADENHLLVVLEDGLLKLEAIGMTGRYWEDASVKYDGDPLAFLIAPKMLQEVVKRSNKVKVTSEKLRVRGPGWAYVTSLTDPDTAREAAEEAAGAAADDEPEGDD
jgi:hypothetical protein